jgi:hypothetical protein
MSHSMTSDEKRAPLKFSRQGYNEVYRKSKDWLENRKFAVAFFFVTFPTVHIAVKNALSPQPINFDDLPVKQEYIC